MTNFPLTDFLFSWSEYRRFYRLSSDDRGIVFYAETGQDFHHFAGIIDRITHLERKSVCYVTSQRNDNIFSLDNPKIKPFYIRAGLLRIIFFQNLRCDLFVLTMTDLGSMHLKRSVNPVHYAYIFHAMGSTHMVDFADSYDHYDTILCSGPHQIREIRRREEMAKLPAKQLIEHGYARIDALIAENRPRQCRIRQDEPGTVLIAPTWGDNSILPLVGKKLVSTLIHAGFKVILRPHWQTMRLTPQVVESILAEHSSNPLFSFEDKMGDTSSLFSSDILVCDWSSTSIEYALGLGKPVLYIDVPRRVHNPDYLKLGIEPLEVSIRNQAGVVVSPDAIDTVPGIINSLLKDPAGFKQKIAALRERTVFNIGRSSEIGAQAIISLADEMAAKRREREKLQ